MCPLCMTTAAVIAASTTAGAGALGFAAVKLRRWRRKHRERIKEPTRSKKTVS